MDANSRWKAHQAMVARMTSNVRPLEDPRGLRKLDRNERRLWQKYYDGEPTMLLDLNKAVSATDADGTLILDKDRKLPTLKDLALFALRTALPEDQNSNFAQKNKRWLVTKRLATCETGLLELANEEIGLIKERIGRAYLQVELVGVAGELLDGGAEVKKPAPCEEVPAEAK